MTQGETVPNIQIVKLYDDARADAHLSALQAIISVENSRASAGKAKRPTTPLISRIRFRHLEGGGLHWYSGTFSPAVVRWIRAREDVIAVEEDMYAGVF